jgi:ABC-2 type transport system ATP-binding protein
MFVFEMKGLSKAEAKNNLNTGLIDSEFKAGGTKKSRNFQKEWLKNSVCRLCFAQAKLLIFDEPFSGFDPVNANIIKDEILALRDQGATIIFNT